MPFTKTGAPESADVVIADDGSTLVDAADDGETREIVDGREEDDDAAGEE